MLTKSLLVWVVHFAAQMSGYHAPANELPTVRFVSEQAIHDAAGGTSEAYTDVYDSGIIYLQTKCKNMRTTFCIGVLVHETTHWLQVKNHKFHGQDCFGPMEKVAYYVEDQYYRTKGQTLEDYGIPAWYLAQITTCANEWEQ